MLNADLIQRIEKFVAEKPRSIDEIAKYLNKNWRTVDRYVDMIKQDSGILSTRVFREGTRGALKVVYLSALNKTSNSTTLQMLEDEILRSRKKEDFSAFDIFQGVDDSKKSSFVTNVEDDKKNLEELHEVISGATKQVLIFSGNLSLINVKNPKHNMLVILDELVSRGVSIKILCRVDIVGKENIERLLALNFKYGKDLVEIHHREHPIRAYIIDNKVMRIKEIKEPTGKIHELDKKVYILYTIKDKVTVEWLSKIFFKMFNLGMDAKRRIAELNKIYH